MVLALKEFTPSLGSLLKCLRIILRSASSVAFDMAKYVGHYYCCAGEAYNVRDGSYTQTFGMFLRGFAKYGQTLICAVCVVCSTHVAQ